MWVLTLILCLIVYYLVKYWINRHLDDWNKRGIPFSKSVSPFMMLLKLIYSDKTFFEIVTDDYYKMKGQKFFGFFQILTPTIMITDPDLIQRVCTKDFCHFVDRNPPSDTVDLFSEGLFGLTSNKWRTLRHKMTPTFTSGKLKMMFKPIRECCDEVVDFISRKIGQDIETRDFMFKYTINVIGNVSFGLKVDALNEETEKNNEFLNCSKLFFKPSFLLIIKMLILMTFPKIRNFFYFSLIDEKVERFFRKLVNDMIEHRERTGEVRKDFLQLMLDQKKKEQVETVEESKKPTINQHNAEEPEDNELLDQLKYMQTENNNYYKSIKVFSDACIVSQTFTFISAGSETTAMALSFILYELAKNPNCQKILQDEVDETISKYEFTYNAIKNMKYMEQIMNESLRIHKIGGVLGRMCTQDYKIPGTDAVIKKGNLISIPLINMCCDPQYFPNPEKFDPSRFEDTDSVHPGIFLPFGAGPRMCIAKRLAILEMKMLLAAVLTRYTVVLSPKTKLPLKMKRSSILQHVEGGLWVQFQERKKQE